MSEKINILINCYFGLKNIKENKIAEALEKILLDKIKITKRGDWINHQICGDFPNIDPRCFVFCCSPDKDCPYRHLALKKVGLTDQDYIEMKKKMTEEVRRWISKS